MMKYCSKKCFLILITIFLFWKSNAQSPFDKIPEHNNVITILPLIGFAGGIGVGITYERLVLKNKRLSVAIPFAYGYRNHLLYDAGSKMKGQPMNSGFLVNPGVRFHVGTYTKRRVAYIAGLSIFAGWGPDNGYRSNGSFAIYSAARDLRMGIFINQLLQYKLSKRFNVELEGTIGGNMIQRSYGLVDEEWKSQTKKNYINNNSGEPSYRLGIGIGFRL